MSAPVVSTTYPARLATDVPLDAELTATTTVALDASTVTSASVLLLNLTLGTVVPISAVTCNYKEITITPAANLTANTRFQATLKTSIASTTGDALAKEYSWNFTTVSATLEAPNISTPTSHSSFVASGVVVAPTFAWAAVSGADHYEIEVSTVQTFGTLVWPTGTTEVDGLSVTPDTAFTTSRTYYWRVRAVAIAAPATESDYGNWSEIRSFYVGTSEVPAEASQVVYSVDSHMLYIVSSSPAVGESHLQATTWTVTFNNNIDAATVDGTTVLVKKFSTYGSPSSNPYVTGTLAVSGKTITFTPATSECETGTSYFTNNNEYCIILTTGVADTAGNSLAEDTTLWFTSVYDPLYLHWNMIRVDLGEFGRTLSIDLINRMLHYASLEVNRFRIEIPSILEGSLPDLVTMVEVLANRVTDSLAHDVMQYVRARAEWLLLRRLRADLLVEGDTRIALGALSEAQTVSTLLGKIAEMMAELKATCDALSYLISYWGGTSPVYVQRSAGYLPNFWDTRDYGKLLNWRTGGNTFVAVSPPTLQVDLSGYIARDGWY